MISTADKVKEQLTRLGFKAHGKEWRGNNPFRDGSDSNGFVVVFNDGEHGAYHNHAGDESGSLYELARLFNIDIPNNGRVQVDNTKGDYAGLEDYAKRHFCPPEAFLSASWCETTLKGRKALKWPTTSGIRARFIDSEGGYCWIGENKGNCWYGLNRAVQMATLRGLPLVLCNGEASTVVAQHYGLAAFSGTGGEGAINEAMVQELNRVWSGQLIIALDCDNKGQHAALKIHEILGRGLIVDLGLSDKGDLADFCGLHTQDVKEALQRLIQNETKQVQETPSAFIEFVSNHAMLSDFHRFIEDEPELFGRTIRMPFGSLRQAGGFANIITTKKVWFIGNVSGGGKTIFSETLCDEFNDLGHSVFYIGDEWTAMELTARAVGRAYSGDNPITFEQYLRYANGELFFTDQQRLDSAYAIRSIRSRYGQTFYMQLRDSISGGAVFLEDVLEAAAGKIRDLRASGQELDVLIIDYLSLYDTKGTANNLEEYKAGIFKSYCKALDVFGISTVQVNKHSEERVKERGGFLNQHDLHFVRPDKANLISTMNTVYVPMIEAYPGNHYSDNEAALRPYINENGQPEPTPNFALTIVKNSIGQAYHYAYFHIDYTRLKVVEGLHPEYVYNKQYHFPFRKR